MRRFGKNQVLRLVAAVLIAAGVVACKGNPGGEGGDGTEAEQTLSITSGSASTSNKYGEIEVRIQLPEAEDKASKAMRASLVAALERECANASSSGEDCGVGAKAASTQEVADAAGKVLVDNFLGMAESVYNERVQEILEDESLDEDGREDEIDYIPEWECRIYMSYLRETSKYAVFYVQQYRDAGGAHGGHCGHGPVVFDKADGQIFTDFLRKGAVDEMQPLLWKGLAEYFEANGEIEDEECVEEELRSMLFLDTDQIPLPEYSLRPVEDGLAFEYQEYEIAPYSSGMPEFTILYEDLLPYLTAAAKRLLDL